MPIKYSSNDITAYFQHCPECDTQWRSHQLRPCSCCDTMGIILHLEEDQIEVLMEVVRTQSYGVNDETDIMFVLSEMMLHLWPDVPAALLAQACWMYLGTQHYTEELETTMKFFEERFEDSLQEYLDEYEWSEEQPHLAPVVEAQAPTTEE